MIKEFISKIDAKLQEIIEISKQKIHKARRDFMIRL